MTGASNLGISYRMTPQTDPRAPRTQAARSGLHPLDALTIMWLGGGATLAAFLFLVV